MVCHLSLQCTYFCFPGLFIRCHLADYTLLAIRMDADIILQHITELHDDNALLIWFNDTEFAYTIKTCNMLKCVYSTGVIKECNEENILEICKHAVKAGVRPRTNIASYIRIALRSRLRSCEEDPDSILMAVKERLQKLKFKYWTVKNKPEYTGIVAGAVITEEGDYYYLMLLYNRKLVKVHYTETFLYPAYIPIYFGRIEWLRRHDMKFIRNVITLQIGKTNEPIGTVKI